MKKSNSPFSPLKDKILHLRSIALRKRKPLDSERINRPVSYWIKEDRLRSGIGKEFTIILRTKGCKWALSENGGCSMCGYIQDASTNDITESNLVAQFDHALSDKIKEITNDSHNYVIKLFNSGSFFDESEISSSTRKAIYEKISNIDKFKEVVVESRVEFINSSVLKEMADSLKKKYIEVAIGLETASDYVRQNYVNKGLLLEDFKQAILNCKKYGIGVKAYLLFKPPFLSEKSAIDDCFDSIKTCIELGVSTISINPINIQKGSLVEFLWKQKKYRPPWFYSLFACLKKALRPEDLKLVRVVSDPSGSGSPRGIHNCTDRNCNEIMMRMLRKFVLTQNIHELNYKESKCNCIFLYESQKNYF
ncbi:MAG: archaeosine biosynthesis radical SAM protein RaSEA [Promethearchaeota archaeon]